MKVKLNMKGLDIRKDVTRIVDDLKTLTGKKIIVGVQSESGKNAFGASVSSSVEMLKRAGIHEHGGTITPKNAKMLAIPLKRSLKGKSPRSLSGNTFVLNTGGKLFIVRDKGEDEIEFCYLLTDKVEMPARPFISSGFEEAMQGELGDFLKKVIALIVAGEDPNELLEIMGNRAVDLITRFMGKGTAAVTPLTASMKKGSNNLVDTGEMQEHITYRLE